MSRWGGARRSGDDLAYGELPQRWDRDRFERFGGGPPPRSYEDDYHYYERDTPRRQDVAVAEHIDARGPRGHYEERDRYNEHDRYTPGGRRRRTDRELFGDVDPREIANMQLTPYRRKSVTREDIDIDIDIDRRSRAPPRPGLVRRQSSLDTFDRRPIPRYEREEHRIPAYTPVPLPYRREERGREYYAPEDYREVEIQREKSVHRSGGPPRSAKSVKSSKSHRSKSHRSSSSSSSTEQVVDDTKSYHQSNRSGSKSIHESFHESFHDDRPPSIHESFHESVHGAPAPSIHDSIQQTEKKFKKGKTRMPKRLVRREAIMDLGYPFDEEEDFFVLRIALEKEQIDEVIRITETYKNGEKKTVYKYEEKVDEAPEVPTGEHEEVLRTEWINPPTVVGDHRSVSRSEHRSRHGSPDSHHSHTTRARSHRSRSQRPSHHGGQSHHGGDLFEERKTVVEERAPPPPPPVAPPVPEFYEERKTTIEETGGYAPSHHTRAPSHHGTMVLQEREYRSDRDIQAEIYKLEAERRALRLEREAEDRRDMAVRLRERPEEEYQVVEYRDRSRPRSRNDLVLYEREREKSRSPDRNVLRVEKDRKARKNAKVIAAAMATLT